MSITAEKIAHVLCKELWIRSPTEPHPEAYVDGVYQAAEAILPLLQQGEPEGFVRVPKAALDWLNGSGPDHEGKWFGEVEDALPQSKHPRKYFWRSHFRKICNAITGKPTFYTYDKSQRALVASPPPLPPAPGAETGGRRLGTAEALQFSDFRKLPEGVRKHFEEIEIFLSDVDGKDLATFTEDSAIDDGTIDCEGVVRAVNAIAAWVQSSSRQAVLEEADYFASLVSRARAAATKATTKFPQPNYVTLKIAEEAGEVVRGCVHYAEKRMDWSEVEGEIVQLLAMLIRLVTEGDQVNGVIPPLATTPPAEGERK